MTTNPPELQPQQSTEQAQNQESEKSFTWLIILLAAITACLVYIYFSNFHSGTPSQERFGQFGDYFGGVLNPILGFATVGLLIWSLKIQTKELALTRQELKETKDEAELSRQAMQDQVKHFEKEAKLNEYLRIMADLRAQFSIVTQNTVSEHELFVEALTRKMPAATAEFRARRRESLSSTPIYSFIYGKSIDVLELNKEAISELKRQYDYAVNNNIVSQWRHLESLLIQFARVAMRYNEESISKDLTLCYLIEAFEMLNPFHRIFQSQATADVLSLLKSRILTLDIFPPYN